MMNCLIVDDDKIMRMEIEQLAKKTTFLNITQSVSNAKEALDIISSGKIDLLFLDVLMPGMSGIDLIKSLNNIRPQIILITSNKKYAVDAFEYNVTDFLSKPISPERFWKAVTKAKEQHDLRINSESDVDHIFLKVDSRLIKVNKNEILYIEANGDYLNVHTLAKRYTIHSTMKGINDKLPGKEFMRVHNSYIIRIDQISSIEDNTIVINKQLIPVSRTYHDELMSKLNKI